LILFKTLRSQTIEIIGFSLISSAYYNVEVSPGYYRPVETKPFTLKCPGADGPVMWIKDGLPFTKEALITYSNGESRINFDSINKEEDSGNYVCISQDGRILHLSAVDVVPQTVYGRLC
jgi:hypothetical protein